MNNYNYTVADNTVKAVGFEDTVTVFDISSWKPDMINYYRSLLSHKRDLEYAEAYLNQMFFQIDTSLIDGALINSLNDIIGPEMAVRLSSDELQQHLDVIRKILNCDGQYANSILHKVDKKFSCEPVGNGYILYYGDNNPLKKTKKVPMRKRRNH